jgi:hypothetical protein
MTFDKLNRRTHLYLGMLLTPWFLLYAASSVLLNHGGWFQGSQDKTAPEWTLRFEKPYRLPTPSNDASPWLLAQEVLRDQGLTGRYRAWFDDHHNLVVLRTRILSTIRLTYYPDRGRLIAENKRLRWREALTAAHFRAGFVYPYFLDWLWAIFVDLVVLATLIWIASGLYMWVRLGRFRFWGWLSLAAGALTFIVAMLHL